MIYDQFLFLDVRSSEIQMCMDSLCICYIYSYYVFVMLVYWKTEKSAITI